MQQAQATVLERGSAKKREGLDNDFRKKLNLLLLVIFQRAQSKLNKPKFNS